MNRTAQFRARPKAVFTWLIGTATALANDCQIPLEGNLLLFLYWILRLPPTGGIRIYFSLYLVLTPPGDQAS